jgi:alpha-L-arabinofuranosidase
VVNVHPDQPAKVDIDLTGFAARAAEAQVITADAMDARPDFGKADPLAPASLRTRVHRGAVGFVAPAKSVVVLTIRTSTTSTAAAE